MRVLRVMVILFPLLAFAGWRQVTTIAGYEDVQVVDAGVVLTVSNTVGASAWLVSDAGVAQLVNLSGGLVGAGYFGANCLIGVASAGAVTYSSGCGTTGSVQVGANTVMRYRLLSDQLPGLALVSNTTSVDSLKSGPNPDAGWDVLGTTWPYAPQGRTLQSARVGGVDYTVMLTGPLAIPARLRVSIDAGAPFDLIVPTMARDAAPFARNGTAAIIMSANGTGALTLIPDVASPTTTLVPSKDAGVVVRYLSMGGVTGMATSAAGSLSAPIPNPARVAELWTLRSAPAVLTDRISCLERWCASVDTATGNVWFYENEAAPSVAVSPVQVDAGQTIRLVATAADPDGDPTYVSWSGGGGGVFTAVAGVDDGTQVDFSAPAGGGVCSAMIDVTVTDGVHDRTVQVPVSILERGLLVASAGPPSVRAGDPAVDYQAGIDGGCVGANLSWSTSDGQMAGGSQLAWVPPATECDADGGVVTITATATWANGAPAATSVNQTVVVEPWGRPFAPVFPSDAGQAAGTTVAYASSGPEHACSGTSDFPGTELVWTINANSGDSGIELDGGLLWVVAPACIASQISASAYRQVIGEDAGRVSPSASLFVDVVPDTAPLPATTEFFISAQGDAGTLFGTVKVDAGCLDERGASAHITVFNGGTFVIDGGFAASDGRWTLPAPGGCAGGVYDIIAELWDNAGFTGASDTGQVTLLFTSAKVGTLSADRIDVVCGEGAKTPLTLLPAPNACGAVEVNWRETSGPALVTVSGTGESLELQTEALDFSTVGQQIALEFSADAGAGNVDVATRTLELGVQPFLEISVKGKPPVRREEDAVALEVTIHNTTSCAVDGLSVTLPFSGGAPIPESALVDDRRAIARLTDDGVVIDGVSVPGSGEVKLQLSVRPRLLSTPTVVPVASLGNYVVSTNVPIPTPGTGCGCSEAPGFLGLFALLLLHRRRRSAG